MKDVVVKPDAAQIALIESLSPKARYHPLLSSRTFEFEGSVEVATPQECYEGWVSDGHASQAAIFVFDDYGLEQLTERIRAEWSAVMPVRLRGSVVNLGEGFKTSRDSYVKTLGEFLSTAEELERGYILQTLFDRDSSEINHRSKQWALKATDCLRATVSPEEAKSLFPAMIVYDHTKFPPDKCKLPADTSERAETIHCVYVLDYVLPRGEALVTNS